MHDVLVIGGGPAGMMAAVQAALAGASTLLVEGMPRCGRKLLLTGGGRCNLTHDCDPASFIDACGPGARFLRNALARFGPAATRDFFQSLGVPIVREPDGRCFPQSGRALDVLGALEAAMKDAGVQVRTGIRASRIDAGQESLVVVVADGREIQARSVVVATGGRSYPQTGSDGRGYSLVTALGHRSATPLPGEVPLVLVDTWPRSLAGMTLPDVRALFGGPDGKVASVRGGLLFTHFGISGPVVLDGSRIAAEWIEAGKASLAIDLVPDRPDDEIDRILADTFGRNGARETRGALREFLPERLSEAIVELILPGRGRSPVARISGRERRSLVRGVKALPLGIECTRGFDEAIVTIGGIDVSGFNPGTLESRIVPGLHVAGEMLDLDGPRGGYNLQIAWSTGWVAGNHAAAVMTYAGP